jgi:hypothetical protein
MINVCDRLVIARFEDMNPHSGNFLQRESPLHMELGAVPGHIRIIDTPSLGSGAG